MRLVGLKYCNKCSNYHKLDWFHKDSNKKDGLSTVCKVCRFLYAKENKDRLKVKRILYAEINREAIREKRLKNQRANRDKYLKINKAWKDSNPEYIQSYREFHRERDNKVSSEKKKRQRAKYNALEANRRAAKYKATPEWSESDKIQILYEKAKWLGTLTGLKYEVDHVIPLVHPNVCGLHIWANLQILEVSLNHSKGNRFNNE